MENTSVEQLSLIKQYLKKTNRNENKSVNQIRTDMAEATVNRVNHSDITVQ